MLEDNNESDMVRHEAAEALGGIATPEVLPHLKSWMNKKDAPRVVRESCQVAIDMWEVCIHLSSTLHYFLIDDMQYENSNELHYSIGAQTLEPVGA